MKSKVKWNVGFYEKEKGVDGYYNSQIIHGGMFDRSLCGTCTCGMLAWLYEKEDMKIHEEIVNKNTLGIKLKGKTVKELRVGNFNAVVPHISGETFITGFNQLILGKEDSLKYGWSGDGTGLRI